VSGEVVVGITADLWHHYEPKYIRDLVIHGRSKHTQEAYTRYVCDLALYYRRSPELISYEQVTGWLYHLIKERQLSASSVNIAVSAVRFLYGVTLGREAHARRKFFQAVELNPKDQSAIGIVAQIDELLGSMPRHATKF
jgi:site-specific recombinase XerD